MSSPMGPAEQFEGGSRPRSCNSRLIRFAAPAIREKNQIVYEGEGSRWTTTRGGERGTRTHVQGEAERVRVETRVSSHHHDESDENLKLWDDSTPVTPGRDDFGPRRLRRLIRSWRISSKFYVVWQLQVASSVPLAHQIRLTVSSVIDSGDLTRTRSLRLGVRVCQCADSQLCGGGGGYEIVWSIVTPCSRSPSMPLFR